VLVVKVTPVAAADVLAVLIFLPPQFLYLFEKAAVQIRVRYELHHGLHSTDEGLIDRPLKPRRPVALSWLQI
jgi:hypothetical protein